jgi:hypothetical protein
MKLEDFYKLHINQEIYMLGSLAKITGLTLDNNKNFNIMFDRSTAFNRWLDICADCSLDAPKQKTKYWQWKVKGLDGFWYRHHIYYNDEGFNTKDERLNGWEKSEKIKIDNEYIEV